MLSKYSQNKLISLKVEIEALLDKIGYTVVYGKGDFKEGTCLIESEKKVVINDYTALDMQVDFMAEVISRLDLSNVFVLPVLRELIDEKMTLFE
ncbi:hypothetical protein KJ762_08160 [bacterium]|nr:hypothetical protein [bacterium]MBU1063721.1 hypothetical protein [bacterium]MBU1634466.1 hypothetical protein [bacterium]MBU1873373.1 hypothetical protein [bacterium]